MTDTAAKTWFPVRKAAASGASGLSALAIAHSSTFSSPSDQPCARPGWDSGRVGPAGRSAESAASSA